MEATGDMMKVVPELSHEQGINLLRQMMLVRHFEDKSAELYTKSKIRGFMHLYNGEEAVSVGVIQALNPEDNVLCTYREHAHALLRNISPGIIMAEMFGKQEGCSKGRGGSMHIFDVKNKFYGGNAIVAGHIPVAVGMALASKKKGEKNITGCFFGEGAVAEGAFHEAMNLAALWQVPVLFICENNLYAMGTALRLSHAMTELEKKGASYGVQSSAVDGMNLLSVIKSANSAVAYIKETGKPYFLVCNTYRFRAHSMLDTELYREKSEVEEWKKRDPIKAFSEYLFKQNSITDNDINEINRQVEETIQKAVDFAEAGTWEPVEQLIKHVYTES